MSLFELPATGLIRLKDVLKLIRVSRSGWYEGVKSGRYPAPRRLGPRTSAYNVEEIRSVIDGSWPGLRQERRHR